MNKRFDSILTHKDGGEQVSVTYRDADSIADLEGRTVSGVHAYCFYGDKLVVVYAKNKDMWTPPGGGVEAGETVEEAVAREVQEESNMRVVRQMLIGYQDIAERAGVVTQVRSGCIVEPYGEFVSDPDEGEITEVKLIDPADYKKYFDWGEIGDHIMQRALELRDALR